MSIFEHYRSKFDELKEEELTLQEYLDLCKKDPLAYASPAERMLNAIGEPELLDTHNDPRLSQIFSNKVIKIYPAFREFYGMEEVIEQIVSFFKHAAQGLEEKKQILYLLGPVGGGKSSLAEKLKSLMEKTPFYAIKGSPVFESPLGLFNVNEDGDILENDYGIPKRYLNTIMSPWATKRLHEFNGDIRQFKVVKIRPSILKQIAVTKTEPGDENNQDISSLVGKVDIRKLEKYSQDDPGCVQLFRRPLPGKSGLARICRNVQSADKSPASLVDSDPGRQLQRHGRFSGDSVSGHYSRPFERIGMAGVQKQ